MTDQNSNIIEFYTNGYKTRAVCIIPQKKSYMFQTSDDRYLEKYWNWDNQCDRNEMVSTRENIINPEWRKLKNGGSDLGIIREAIAALNYNSTRFEIDNLIKEYIDYIVNNSRYIWSSIENELIPDPVPMPSDKDNTNLLGFNRITKYGVTLKRLSHDKIELVRRWRNNPKISQYMEYRDEITPEMQEIWFRKIDNVNNFYFIIEAEEKEIGLINVRDIDYEKGEGEPGIFIWNDDFLNSTYSFKSVLNLTDFCFETLGLKELVIHILRDNKRAIQFNKAYGYELSQDQDNVYNQEYRMGYSRYVSKRKKIINLLK